MNMRLVFMGTPEFSVNTLEVLKAVGNEICAVFTQPDLSLIHISEPTRQYS